MIYGNKLPEANITGTCSVCGGDIIGEVEPCDCGQHPCKECVKPCAECTWIGCTVCMKHDDKSGEYFCHEECIVDYHRKDEE